MKRIDTASASASKHGSGKNGFTDGNPGVTAATTVDADWFDGVQEEIVGTIELVGQTPVATDLYQLRRGIARMLASSWTEGAQLSGIDEPLFSLASNGLGEWVAVGSADLGTSGIMLRSTDNGQTLANLAPTKQIDLHDICFVPSLSLYIAVGAADGSDAYILTLPEGSSSEAERSNPKNVALNAVATNDSIIVAAGDYDGTDVYCVTSVDGTTWTERTLPGSSGDRVNAIVWTGTAFVAVGDNGGSPRAWTSPDGITWTARTISGSGNNSCACFNGSAIVTNSHRSTDAGATWSAYSAPTVFSGLAADPTSGLILGVNSTSAYFSLDHGISWSQNVGHIASHTSTRCVAFAGGRFVSGDRAAGAGDAVLFRSHGYL